MDETDRRALPKAGGMKITAPPETGTQRRTQLTRDRVVAAAVALADRDGIEALSMRRLAQELGTDHQHFLLRAETALNRVLEFNESHVEAWYWLGATFVLAGRDRDARTVVEVLEPLDVGRSLDLESLRRDAVATRSSRSTTA